SPSRRCSVLPLAFLLLEGKTRAAATYPHQLEREGTPSPVAELKPPPLGVSSAHDAACAIRSADHELERHGADEEEKMGGRQHRRRATADEDDDHDVVRTAVEHDAASTPLSTTTPSSSTEKRRRCSRSASTRTVPPPPLEP
ncbi:unnamed protein product, partial [Urochloa humidicola]